MQLIGDADAVLPTREWGHMCEEFGIDRTTHEDGEFEDLMVASTSPAAIFGVI